jgi:hypothetical protein
MVSADVERGRMRVRTTSTQRTYRYVRLALVGVVIFLAASLAAQISSGGTLTSVSAAYYTPAQPVFVASLCAVALALVALSGRSLEQALLDVAALFAPVIALVPTPVEIGDVAGYAPDCPDGASCVPAAVIPAVANGMLSLAVIGTLGVVAAAVLARLQGTLSPALVLALGVAAAAVAGMTLWWVLAPASFLLGAHNGTAFVFFALIAAAAALGARRPAADDPRRTRLLRAAYALTAGGLTLALAFLAVVIVLRAVGVDLVDATGVPLVLWGEAVALGLFAVFWLVQTVELWDDPDPATIR